MVPQQLGNLCHVIAELNHWLITLLLKLSKNNPNNPTMDCFYHADWPGERAEPAAASGLLDRSVDCLEG